MQLEDEHVPPVSQYWWRQTRKHCTTQPPLELESFMSQSANRCSRKDTRLPVPRAHAPSCEPVEKTQHAPTLSLIFHGSYTQTASSSPQIQPQIFHCTRAGPNSSRYTVSPGMSRSAEEEFLRPEIDQTHRFHLRLRHDLNSEKKRSTEFESCSNPVTLHLGVDSVCENDACSRVVNVAGVQNPRPTRCK